ncbi:hypothetical protein [Haloferax sp. Atlit-12N]|uniref:hypothetical protein n=1 Tax=Haloferax sp. Atlit-12N TaxID=2077203 RepID=UPI0011E5C4D8|nr:hypothetical protein [Haloferax sp. Atlit-12N]
MYSQMLGSLTTQQSTLFVAAATLFGAFIGSITQFAIKRHEQRNAIQSLRIALISEINALPDLDSDAMSQLVHFDKTTDIPVSRVYETNTDKIGNLTKKEAKAVAQFYSGLLSAKTLAETGGNVSTEAVGELFGSLEDNRQDVIDALESEL